MNVKVILSFLITLFITSSLFCLWLYHQQNAVTIVSLESKTRDGSPVYNKIQLIPGDKQDIWLMQQSHFGSDVPLRLWDRLAIVVEKNFKPAKATFYQFRNSDLPMDFPQESVSLKVRCFACHASGPRLIRADTKVLNTSWLDKLKIALWNLRIKTYGRVESHASDKSSIPFRSEHKALKQPIGLSSCEFCHHEGGIRNALTLEHMETASFLVDQGEMPPFPFALNPKDRERLEYYKKLRSLPNNF